MWRPDRSLRGPERATLARHRALNRVFAEAFTDRYSRDGLVGRARAPPQPADLALRASRMRATAPCSGGTRDGQIVGFNMVHRSGTEGWMGPLAVRPDRQGEGLGLHDGAGRHRLAQGAGRQDHRARDHAAHGREHRLLQPARLRAGAPHRHPGARSRRAASAASPERSRRAGHRVDARLDECRALTDAARAGRGLHSRARADARAGTRRYHAGPRRGRAGRFRALALGAAGRRAARRTRSACSSWWRRTSRRSSGWSTRFRAAAEAERRPARSPSAARPRSPRRTCGWSRRLPGALDRPADDAAGFPEAARGDGIVMSNWEI